MSRTVAYALDFVLDTLDYSPDDAIPPRDEAELRTQPSAEPLSKENFAVIVWNDEKHSFEEVIHNIADATGCSKDMATEIAYRIDDEVSTLVSLGIIDH